MKGLRRQYKPVIVAANEIGASRDFVKGLLKSGDLKGHRIGTKRTSPWVVEVKSLEAYKARINAAA
jgi:hypothetical protein